MEIGPNECSQDGGHLHRDLHYSHNFGTCTIAIPGQSSHHCQIYLKPTRHTPSHPKASDKKNAECRAKPQKQQLRQEQRHEEAHTGMSMLRGLLERSYIERYEERLDASIQLFLSLACVVRSGIVGRIPVPVFSWTTITRCTGQSCKLHCEQVFPDYIYFTLRAPLSQPTAASGWRFYRGCCFRIINVSTITASIPSSTPFNSQNMPK